MKRIAFTGDLGFSSKYFRGTYNNENLLDEECISYLQDTDYTVVNVEGCVSSATASASKPLLHANPPECLDFLRKINGNVWALANNHINDCGREGVESTLKIASENSIKTVGVGMNIAEAEKPVILENDGADIGIVAVTVEKEAATEEKEGCVSWCDNERIERMIKNVKETCRWCVIIVHSGPEFCQLMPPAVRKQYKKYLEFGADIVIGHHPHVTQNYETFGDKIIFYSLGNFIFDTDYQRLQKYTEYGVLVKFCFDKDKFTWDSKALKIDRETQTIHACETPDIFANVSAGQYGLLWPLAMRDLYQNQHVARKFLYPKFKDFNDWNWMIYHIKMRKETPRNKGILGGRILSWFNLWRFGDKKIANYIKNGR